MSVTKPIISLAPLSSNGHVSIGSVGNSFIVLYQGSRTFWKTRTNLDIIILEHPKHKCLELIPYNIDLAKEAPRIYFYSELLKSKLNYNEVSDKVSEKKEKYIREKKSFVAENLTKEVINQMMAQYITSRITISNDSNDFEISLLKNIGDIVDENTNKLDVVCTRPNGMIHEEFHHQKPATVEDFKLALSKLQKETLELNAASSQATRLAGLAVSSVEGFKGLLKSKSIFEDDSISKSKQRWRKAIRRVITNNYIAAVRRRLDHDHPVAIVPIVDLHSEAILDNGKVLNVTRSLPSLSAQKSANLAQGRKMSMMHLPSLNQDKKKNGPSLSSKSENIIEANRRSTFPEPQSLDSGSIVSIAGK
eukprot:gene14847-19955_t